MYSGSAITCVRIADTYKLRELKDGSKHLVVKDHLSKEELVRMLQ